MTLALDIETAAIEHYPQEYALQPWRYLEGSANVTCIAVARANGESLLRTDNYRAVLQSLAGEEVHTWNGVFDVSWLIAMGFWDEVKAIKWVDSMLLWKWLDNSQRKERMPAWSLADGAKKFCADEPWLEAFLRMKAEADTDVEQGTAYWEKRGKLDAIVTAKIGESVLSQLSDRKIQSAMIEMENIPEVARSWVIGVPMDYSLVDSIAPTVTEEMMHLEFRLGVSNFKTAAESRAVVQDPTIWTPSAILRSPKQLSELLYDKWKMEVKHRTKKGAPSTDKTALTYLADEDDQVIQILRWRELNTQLTKYLQTPLKAREYLGKDTVHPAPRMFNTYTGRFTYTSKTKGEATGVALHQWPRNKAFRALIVPPPGYKHVEYDAAGQESRIMAEQSGDVAMRQAFTDNQKLHAVTGARIAGMSYEAFMKGRASGNSAINGEHGLYYQGKFTNLSNNFRIGVPKLRVQARVQYGMDVDFFTAQKWQNVFHDGFVSVKPYWKSAIETGKAVGHATSLAGRTFGLSYWDKESKWSTESSALMFPIQGTGADMKELGIRELARHYPEFIFWFDLHDGLHMLVKEDVPNSKLLEARDMLDNIDYEKEWGVKLSVPLLWDCSVGPRWSELEEL